MRRIASRIANRSGLARGSLSSAKWALSGGLATVLTFGACSGGYIHGTDTATASSSTGSASEGTVGSTTMAATTADSTTGLTSDSGSTVAETTGPTTGTTGPTTGTTGITGTTGTTDSTGTKGTTGTTGDNGDNCCEPQESAGCADNAVAECVCVEDAYCCTEQWDGQCVQEVELFGCGMCEDMDLGCCGAHESPSCDDEGVAQCVCAQDSYCCETSWDGQCAEEVELFGCGMCGGGDDPCCLPHGSPGCVDPEVAACVCEDNPYCCEQMWDEACVAAVADLGCGICEDEGACCEAHGGLGCADQGVEACVCEIAPGCCEGAWDEVCVGLVEFLECGLCAPPAAACCEPHDSPGCDQPDIEACVCEGAPECCEGPWTAGCSDAVELFGCGSCGGGEGPCCEAHAGPGCDDPEVSSCVCADDPACCDSEWDVQCVDEVELFGCGLCGGGDSCCEVHDTPGCVDADVEACVCAEDPFCCADGWDDLCVEEVTSLGCGVCG